VITVSANGQLGGQNEIDNKGYTGQEMLDQLQLVHLNGRVYDPFTARFISADPEIQDPTHSQSYNRYSYAWNNPTNDTDPSGFEEAKKTDTSPPPCNDACKKINDAVAAAKKTDGKVQIQLGEGKSVEISFKNGAVDTVTATIGGRTPSISNTLKSFIGQAFNDTIGALPGVSKMSVDPLSSGAVGGATIAAMIGGEEEAGVTAVKATLEAAPKLVEEGAKAVQEGENFIYRSATGTAESMTPRAKDVNGLSAANSLENALPGKNQIIDASKLKSLCAVCDNPATGHVSIFPKDMSQMQSWINSRGNEVHAFTQELLDAVVGTVKK
jgi:RHS repeat-associated protein